MRLGAVQPARGAALSSASALASAQGPSRRGGARPLSRLPGETLFDAAGRDEVVGRHLEQVAREEARLAVDAVQARVVQRAVDQRLAALDAEHRLRERRQRQGEVAEAAE